MIGRSDLTPEELKFRERCEALLQETATPELLHALDHNEVDYPTSFIRAAGEKGLLGLNVGVAYGGLGASFMYDAIMSEVTGYYGTATMACARTFTAHIGYVLDRYGSNFIQSNYLEPMIAGRVIACQGMTEPAAGSDLAGIQARLTRTASGWRLRGQKRFVDGAQTAKFMLAAVRLGVAENPRDDFVAVVVNTEDPGFIIREVQNDWHGFRGMGSSWIEFRDIPIPAENIVGEPGSAWKMFMEELMIERVVMTRAQLGQAERALRIALEYARHRRTFGKPLIDHDVIAFRLAHAAAALDAAFLLNTRAARLLDQSMSREADLEIAMAKYVGTETAWQVADEALQILGGMGYTTKYPVERIQRDIRAARITGGSSEMMQHIIAKQMRRLPRDASFRGELIGNELNGSPVFPEWGEAPPAFHPADQTVLHTMRPTLHSRDETLPTGKRS